MKLNIDMCYTYLILKNQCSPVYGNVKCSLPLDFKFTWTADTNMHEQWMNNNLYSNILDSINLKSLYPIDLKMSIFLSPDQC